MQGAQGQLRFLPLPAGGYTTSKATAISGDASTIIGYADKTGARGGFYWNETDGTVLIPNLPGYSYMEPHGVSYDGSVIVGFVQETGLSTTYYAFAWDANSGTVNLTPAGTTVQMGATAVSDDGLTIVGWRDNILNGWLWRSGIGLIALEHPGDMAVGGFCNPNCLSGDGTLIGGYYDKTGATQQPAAFWDGGDGSFLGSLSPTRTGAGVSSVLALSYDGSMGVGGPIANNLGTFGASISRSGKVIAGTRPSPDTNKWWTVANQSTLTYYDSATGTVRRGLHGGDEVVLLQGRPVGALLKTAGDGVVYSLTSEGPQAARLTMLVTGSYS